MCSLSWIRGNFGLSLCFTRDEQYSRPLAEKPVILEREDVQVISPIDPLGGGSWIAVNDKGVIVGVLNYYRQRKIDPARDIPGNKIQSRGLLVNHLSSVANLSQFERRLAKEKFSCYAPCSLIYLDEAHARLWTWNGQSLTHSELPAFISSSGFQPGLVEPLRAEQFVTVHPQTPQQQVEFHRAHFELSGDEHEICQRVGLKHEKTNQRSITCDPWSICMHRDDAHSVSLSHILINQAIRFRYWDGQPCETESYDQIEMPRQPITQPVYQVS